MWWAVTALTTVGYGDVYPITPLGRFLGSVISLLGIGMFALPAGIMASGFTDIIKSRKKKSLCPHCGKDLK
jgi:voltage-gated potassium channel